MIIRAYWRLAACLLLGFGVAEALAQSASISRPSSGPSNRVGRVGDVGGRNTRTSSSAAPRSTSDSFSFSAPSVRRPGLPGTGYIPPPPVVQGSGGFIAVTRQPIDYRARMFFPEAYGERYLVTEQQLNLGTPLVDAVTTSSDYLPPPRFQYARPLDERDDFQRFFNLTPQAGPDPELPLPPRQDFAAAIESSSASYIQTQEHRALDLFKGGTNLADPDRHEKLSRAIDVFSTVKTAEPSRYVPCLLTLHAAMLKEQPNVALYNLFAAIARHPDLFQEKPEMLQYFGSPEVLNDQVRHYSRFRREDLTSLMDVPLFAYYAWLAGDQVRLQMALDELRKLVRDNPRAENASGAQLVLSALEAATR